MRYVEAEALEQWIIEFHPADAYWAVSMLKNASTANVVETPCKVGDTAYMVTTNGEIRELTVTDIDIKLRKDEASIICHAEYEQDGELYNLQIVPDRIGKTYFFSLYAAQKALLHSRLDEQIKGAAGQKQPGSPPAPGAVENVRD